MESPTRVEIDTEQIYRTVRGPYTTSSLIGLFSMGSTKNRKINKYKIGGDEKGSLEGYWTLSNSHKRKRSTFLQ